MRVCEARRGSTAHLEWRALLVKRRQGGSLEMVALGFLRDSSLLLVGFWGSEGPREGIGETGDDMGQGRSCLDVWVTYD